MTHHRRHTAILLFIFQITATYSAKTSARPVHEVINEQARIDDKRTQTTAENLPYGNPLAGNSQHNAKLHAQNQQAMFHAERVRQLRAQLQIWNKVPQQTDSYMRAYHESQENHQLALEQQQTNLRDKKPPVTARPRQRQRPENLKRTKGPDPIKFTKDDSIVTEKNRNHRSYGSVEYNQHLQPKRYKTVFITPGPTYDQGVTIKPNGNVGITNFDTKENNLLFTQAVPSKTQHVYPKQYTQMQNYESAHDIATLNNLLNKQPQDQLTELNALIQTEKELGKELEIPIDYFFYLKDPKLAQHYAQSMYAQIPQNYASAYMPVIKDHTPITEEIDDIEDPNKVTKRPFTPQPLFTKFPEDITTNTINYFHLEPTVVTIPEHNNLLKEEEQPSYSALKYERPLKYSSQDVASEDTSERYLHHNGQYIGVQHLNQDGTGVSAYSDDNLQYAANYEFGYHVRDHHTGNDFGHREAKINGKTDGQYHVLLPDGRMQNVIYHAGPEGFHADISYERK